MEAQREKLVGDSKNLRVELEVIEAKLTVLQDLLRNQLDASKADEESQKEHEIREEINDCRIFFSKPYIKTGPDKTAMAAPMLDPRVSLPFDLRKKTQEWSETQRKRMKICVRKAYYSRMIFFLESRFEQFLMKMNFTGEELIPMDQIRNELDQELWKIENRWYSDIKKQREESQKLIEQTWTKDNKFFQAAIQLHNMERLPLRPLILYRSKDSDISAEMSINDFIKWRQAELRQIYNEQLSHKEIDVNKVDWDMVSKEMYGFLKRPITGVQCEKIFKLTISESLNHGPGTLGELTQLKRLTKNRKYIDWRSIVQKLGTNRSALRVYHMYRMHIALKPMKKKKWISSEGHKAVVVAVRKYKGNLGKVVAQVSKKFGEISMQKLKQNYHRTLNPRYTRGRFFTSEDAVLLVVLELQRNEILNEDFSDMHMYLPWRNYTTWRSRANVLYRDFGKATVSTPTQWTITEDKMLLKIGKDGLSLKRCQKLFPSRTRYSCVVRHRTLVKKLKLMTLEEYHLVYSRRSFVIQSMCPKLMAIAKRLEAIIEAKHKATMEESEANLSNLPQPETFDPESYYNPVEYVATVPASKRICDINPQIFVRSPPADEKPIREYLKSFNIILLAGVYKRLVGYIRNTYTVLSVLESKVSGTPQLAIMGPPQLAIEGPHSISEKGMLCDRRKFIRTDPISVASALHLRRVSLVPQRKNEFSDFENKIYTYYNIFHAGNPTKKSAKRSGIPSELELAVMPELSRIIAPAKEIMLILKPANIVSHPLEESTEVKHVLAFEGSVLPDEVPQNWRAAEAKLKLTNRGLGTKGILGKTKKTMKRLRRKAAAAARWDKSKTCLQNNQNEASNHSSELDSSEGSDNLKSQNEACNYPSELEVSEGFEPNHSTSEKDSSCIVFHDHTYALGLTNIK